MKLETLAISNLTLDPNNARTHDNANLEAIAGSLTQFGQRKPIVIDQNNVVVAGNGTVTAAQSLGWTEIQAVRVPADWDADRIKAFALADNRTAELAGWNQEVLNQQLRELEEVGIEVASFGFEVPDIPILDIETFEDEYPEEVAVRTQLGDVWQLGKHRLVCGDSTNPDVVKTALGGQEADCVFTDPPYNVAYEGKTKDKLTIQNDDMTDNQFGKFLFDFYAAAISNTKAGGPIYVCHADSEGESFRHNMVASGWLLKQCIIWVKNSLVLGRQDYNWQHEPILYGWKPGAAHSWYGPFTNTTIFESEKKDLTKLSKQELQEILEQAFTTSTVVREKRPSRSSIHPTMKPIALVSKLLKNSCVKDDLVLDQFGGSGSTLIACEQLGLRAGLVELDPKYCDATIQRWENLTGEKAELVNASR
jgi:DNA modification methylase